MNRIENLLLTAANDTKPGGTSSTLEDGLELQNNLDTLEKQPGKKNRLQFSRNKGKTCCLCKNSRAAEHSTGREWVSQESQNSLG